MLIRCWGARGSIPVSGWQYLWYGGDTPCIEVRTKDDDIVIIDAGSGIRRLGNLLLAEGRNRYTMIFTHVHWDHVMGFPYFKPIYHRETHIDFFGSTSARDSVRNLISGIMSPPNFPVKFEDITAEIDYREVHRSPIQIGSLTITPIPLSHPNQGMGYRLEEDGKSFVFLTDNELTFRHPGGMAYEDYCEFSKGADLLVHDAEYRAEEYRRTRTWGHSVYTDALRLAVDAGAMTLGLYHHNQERTDQDLEAMVEDCRRTAGRSLSCFAMRQDMEIVI